MITSPTYSIVIMIFIRSYRVVKMNACKKSASFFLNRRSNHSKDKERTNESLPLFRTKMEQTTKFEWRKKRRLLNNHHKYCMRTSFSSLAFFCRLSNHPSIPKARQERNTRTDNCLWHAMLACVFFSWSSSSSFCCCRENMSRSRASRSHFWLTYDNDHALFGWGKKE